jgi:hypothetical protein
MKMVVRILARARGPPPQAVWKRFQARAKGAHGRPGSCSGSKNTIPIKWRLCYRRIWAAAAQQRRYMQLAVFSAII